MARFGRAKTSTSPFNWLVVGLGNPGAKFARTRHNVGQECVEELARRHDTKLKGGRDNALVGEARFGVGEGSERVVLAFPITFMNESGLAVGALMRRYGIEDPTRLIVVHDELDLDPGVVRLKAGGGLAGHNGLRSITQHIHTQDYLRIRIGVGKPPHKDAGAGHVLNRVPADQRTLLDVAVNIAADAAETIIDDGINEAMAAFHSKQ